MLSERRSPQPGGPGSRVPPSARSPGHSASTRACGRSRTPCWPSSPSGVDAVYKWGMDCPDCIYTGAPLRGGETYRLWGPRGSARYVGLQSMAGMASSANVLLDELDLGPGGEVELVLSAEPHEGNWLPIAENATQLVVRHFFYDWDTEVASSLSIERVGSAATGHRRDAAIDPRAVVARQLVALGDFVAGQPRVLPAVLATRDAEHLPSSARRDGHGRGSREPARHRLLGSSSQTRRCWSRSRRPRVSTGATPSAIRGGRPSTTRRHQSSLNGHQAGVDDDGIVRAVIAHEDPGVANWLDTAGHSAGPVILRCVRTESAPVPTTRVVSWPTIAAALPAGTRRVTPEERRRVDRRPAAGRQQEVLPMTLDADEIEREAREETGLRRLRRRAAPRGARAPGRVR